MERKSLFIFSALALFALGIALIIVGVSGAKVIIAPVLSGIAFIINATVFMNMGRSMK